MKQFASGPKRNFYGKGDVTVYRLVRDGRAPEGESPVFGANVLMLVYGDAFWPTYTTGDNTDLVATDSMKNFIQRETMTFPGSNLETFCEFLAGKFLAKYPQVEGIQVSAREVPYDPLPGTAIAFAPSGPDRATARVEIGRNERGTVLVEACSGIENLRLLRLSGSAFRGFVRDEYTTLPDIANRPLHMWLDLEWTYGSAPGFRRAGTAGRVRKLVHDVFTAFESGSIQQVIHKMGTEMLSAIPEIESIRLEAQNRTWDTIVENGQQSGVYTDARPPYGCLGLTMRR
ncbi:MAG: Urate oxidase [Bryobacterales bacterium]|nr:Urate oxidase [Bryobacterales bacterium]